MASTIPLTAKLPSSSYKGVDFFYGCIKALENQSLHVVNCFLKRDEKKIKSDVKKIEQSALLFRSRIAQRRNNNCYIQCAITAIIGLGAIMFLYCWK